jgi:D-psicose/D-tagatose/L-ribulose 3-epimerase
VQFGVAIPAASASTAAEMGYGFVELRVSELAPEDAGDGWRATERAVAAAGIPALTYNFFLPPDLPVVGPSVDADRLRRYVARAAERASAMGGRTFVFGSGGARRVPDGFPSDEAMGQYREAVRIAAGEAGRHGMGIALEALNRTEANLLHTLEQAAEQAGLVELANVGVAADSYHMQMVGEPFSHLLDVGQRLRHVQVCDTGRRPPGAGVADLGGFFIYLNALRYDGSVAVESAFSDFADEGPRALATIRELATLRGELTFAQ